MEPLNDTRRVFFKCGTCSRTFSHLLNREFGYNKPNEEKATDLLAGGIVNTGHQCGMLWGTTLAIGAESYRRYSNLNQATEIAIYTTQKAMESFIHRTQTPNCREITHCNLDTGWGMTKLMVKTIVTGFVFSPCFNLAAKWAPELIDTVNLCFTKQPSEPKEKCLNCASEVVRLMGGNDEEIAIVAGFAGGMGLSGNGCGALSASIWMKTLKWCRQYPNKKVPYYKNPIAMETLIRFKEATNSEILCSKICGQKFNTIYEHSYFVQNDGCKNLIKLLAQ